MVFACAQQMMSPGVLAVDALAEASREGMPAGRRLVKPVVQLMQAAHDAFVPKSAPQRAVVHVSSAEMRSEGDGQGPWQYACVHCSLRFATSEGCRMHIRSRHVNDRPWLCFAPDCARTIFRPCATSQVRKCSRTYGSWNLL